MKGSTYTFRLTVATDGAEAGDVADFIAGLLDENGIDSEPLELIAVNGTPV